MIRLIVSDMDGTLLRDDGTMHKGMVPLIQGLREKGIIFIAASGRPAFNLHEQFQEVYSEIGAIAFNGACLHYKGRIQKFSSVDPDVCRGIVKKVRKKDGIYVNMDGIDTSYLEDLECPLWEWKDAREHMKVENLEYVVEREPIYRVSVMKKMGNEYPEEIAEMLEEYRGKAELIRSDSRGMDLSGLGNSKGRALEWIQDFLKVTPEETMVFGDYYNDKELFLRAKYSFAPINACEEITSLAWKIIGDHNQDSVYDTIQNYLNSEKEFPEK